MAGLSRMHSHHPQNPSPLSEHQIKDPAPADDAEPKPRRARKPVGWSMIVIGALVAVCAGLVWRRDGIDGVLKILTHDLWLFGEIIPRVLAGCLLGAFIAEILPHGGWARLPRPRRPSRSRSLEALPAEPGHTQLISGARRRCQGQSVRPERREPRSDGLDCRRPAELAGPRARILDAVNRYLSATRRWHRWRCGFGGSRVGASPVGVQA